MKLIMIIFFIFIFEYANCAIEKEKTPIYLEFSAGLNTNTIYQSPTAIEPYSKNSYNYNIGISLPIINEKSHLLFNLAYILRKNKLYEYNSTFTNKKIENIEDNHYLVLNSNYKYDIKTYKNNTLYLKSGLFLAYLINTDNLMDVNHRIEEDPNYNKLDAGLNIGLGYTYSISYYKIGLEYIFQQGFINKLDAYDKYWNQSHLVNLVFNVSIN